MTRQSGPTLVTATCGQCSAEFSLTLVDHKRGKGKYCSRACTALGQQRRVSVPCGHCNQPFAVLEWQRRRGLGKFCSLTCASSAKESQYQDAASRMPLALTCQQCGAAFTKPAWVLNKAGRGKYCSAPCANKGRAARTPTVTPKSSQRPSPVTPRADDLPLVDGGSHVRCHGCQELRPRGQFCARCEHRAAEMLAS
jgi:hypothetical protein